MKRFLLLVCCFFVSLMSFCQDVIITKDAKRIECVISEVSSTEIRYKLWDNQQGPTFVLQTTEISSIIFQNGSVQVFDTPQQAPEQTTTAAFDNNHTPFFDGEINDFGEIQKSDDTYTLKYKEKTISMSEFAYMHFIKKNAPEAWKKYNQSVQMITAGWGLLGFGITLLTAGIPLAYYWEPGDATFATGMVFVSFGSAATVSSVTLFSLGYKSKSLNYEYYNQTVRYKSQFSLNLQSSKDGIGLALRF